MLFDAVALQVGLLFEGVVTVEALERPDPDVADHVPFRVGQVREELVAHVAAEGVVAHPPIHFVYFLRVGGTRVSLLLLLPVKGNDLVLPGPFLLNLMPQRLLLLPTSFILILTLLAISSSSTS